MRSDTPAESRSGPAVAAACEPLLEFAAPDMYRKNAFRVLGLGTGVSLRPKELERHRMLAELAQTTAPRSPGRLELRPPASGDELQAAEAVLHEPDQRLVHELFWFWPLDSYSGAPDSALRALQAGDLKAAARFWEACKKGPQLNASQIAIAKHNIAVRWHLCALEAEQRTQGDVWNDDERSDIIRKVWAASLAYWSDSIRNDAIWNALSARVIALNDQRLSPEFVQSMRDTVGRALLKVNASLALRYAESNRSVGTAEHLNILLKSPLIADEGFTIDEFLIAPLKSRVRQRIADAEKGRTNAPAEGNAQTKTLMDAFSKYQGVLRALDPANSSDDLGGLYDKVAAQCLSCVIAFHNVTDNDKDATVLLQGVLPLARSEELRSKIETSITTGKDNLLFAKLTPLIEPLKAIKESKSSPRERLTAFIRTVEPMITAVNDVLAQSTTMRASTFDRLARALRDISLDAWNLSKDGLTAIDALGRADRYAVSPEVKAQLVTDRAALVRLHAKQRREARAAKNKKYAWGVGIAAAVAVVIAVNLNDRSSSGSSTATTASSSALDTTSDTLDQDRAAAERAKAEVTQLRAQLAAAEEALNARRRDAGTVKSELDQLGASIDQERAFLDSTDENAFGQFNSRVEEYNRLLTHARALVTRADELVDPYNALLARVETKTREADRLSDAYNRELKEYGRSQ